MRLDDLKRDLIEAKERYRIMVEKVRAFDPQWNEPVQSLYLNGEHINYNPTLLPRELLAEVREVERGPRSPFAIESQIEAEYEALGRAAPALYLALEAAVAFVKERGLEGAPIEKWEAALRKVEEG